MLWSILFIACCLAPLVVFIVALCDYDGFWVSLGRAFFGAFVAFAALCIGTLLVMGLANITPPTHSEDRVEIIQLQAVGSADSVTGHSSFLAGGYIDGKRVLNYTQQHDGYSTLERVDADKARIVEDGKKELQLKSKAEWRWWLYPDDQKMDEFYEFHIPENSIVENFEIK